MITCDILSTVLTVFLWAREGIKAMFLIICAVLPRGKLVLVKQIISKCHCVLSTLPGIADIMTLRHGSRPGGVAQLVGPSSHTPKGCRFDSWSGHGQEATGRCFSLTSMFLPLSLSNQ